MTRRRYKIATVGTLEPKGRCCSGRKITVPTNVRGTEGIPAGAQGGVPGVSDIGRATKSQLNIPTVNCTGAVIGDVDIKLIAAVPNIGFAYFAINREYIH